GGELGKIVDVRDHGDVRTVKSSQAAAAIAVKRILYRTDRRVAGADIDGLGPSVVPLERKSIRKPLGQHSLQRIVGRIRIGRVALHGGVQRVMNAPRIGVFCGGTRTVYRGVLVGS